MFLMYFKNIFNMFLQRFYLSFIAMEFKIIIRILHFHTFTLFIH